MGASILKSGERPVRRARKPLYVQVVTQPTLHGCWAVNISESGIGLIAMPGDVEKGPHEGQEVELAFTLPDSQARVRAKGRVRWRHEPEEREEGAVTALGVSFQRFYEAEDLAKLRHYLLNHRLLVAAAYAEEEETRVIRKALEGQSGVRFIGAAEDLEALLTRGDVCALLVCGRQEERAVALVEHVAARRAAADPTGAGPASDMAPRIIYCAPAAPSRLVELFNSGLIFRALPPPRSADALRSAVLQASRDLGVRTEQRRMAMELERNLLRERARERHQQAHSPDREETAGMRSPPMQHVMELVRVAAPHRVAVLLQGETGTGKEVVARMLHKLSLRREGALVVQDCGALTETLLESELFGHVKGAFTGAVADHPGLFVIADGGTIFLDEIENTPPKLQVRLLRVLESGDVRPVGGAQVRRVDVRVIAASNRNLSEEVHTGHFRSDLFYRLNSFTIDLPPLRERPEDVIDLAHFFLEHFNRTLKRSASGLTQETRQVLLAARWHGNVRELRNAMERAVLLCAPGAQVTPRHLPPSLVASVQDSPERSGGAASLRERLEEVERELIRQALEQHGGVMRRAATALGMDPVTLGRRARRHGLGRPPRSSAT